MTPDELDTRATAIYGADWKAPLSAKVGVDARTMRRYRAGERAIPDWLEVVLGMLERHPEER